VEVLSVTKSTQTYVDYPLHQHGYWEIIFSLQGNGTIQILDRLYPFTERTVCCIPPWTPHRKTAEGGFVDGCMFVSDLIPPGGPEKYVFMDDQDLPLMTLFRLAYETQLKGEANARQIINALGDAIYQILIRIGAEPGGRRNDAVESFRSLLLENISNCEFSLADAVRATGYSESYFRKVFRDSLGSAPVEYFTHLRIEHAKRQLRQYHDVRSIREIAESAGFSDPYYFSRKFRQYTGRSPRRYVQELDASDFELLVHELASDGEDPEAELRRR